MVVGCMGGGVNKLKKQILETNEKMKTRIGNEMFKTVFAESGSVGKVLCIIIAVAWNREKWPVYLGGLSKHNQPYEKTEHKHNNQ